MLRIKSRSFQVDVKEVESHGKKETCRIRTMMTEQGYKSVSVKIIDEGKDVNDPSLSFNSVFVKLSGDINNEDETNGVYEYIQDRGKLFRLPQPV